ncbi:MAG: type II secretion system secretin GspD [Deltaproteobacteria bacterium]|nr:type II secretion system secretin GspD [Deltaproteobacteria bacterium]
MKRGRSTVRVLTFVVLATVMFFPRIGWEQEWESKDLTKGEKESGRITMNFKDVDIGVFIKFISELTGKNFLVYPGVKGNVTVLSPEKVTVDEAYKVFLSVLEVHGYSAVPSGKIIKIVPATEARTKGLKSRFTSRPGSGDDRIITQLVHLEHGDATEFARLLKPLVAKTGLLLSYVDTNTLIIIDTLSNIDRLLRIIRKLDIPASKEKIIVYNLGYANAKTLASTLVDLFRVKRAKKGVSHQVKIVSYERTNSLIVLAPAQILSDIEDILKKLDQKQVRPRGNIHIYPLQNAVAENVAKVLGEIPRKGQGGQQKGKAPPLSKDVQITADKATNTLVIVAEPEEYQILVDIIRELDKRRTMVYVEALIMEVSSSKALNLGVEWRTGDEYKGGLANSGRGGHWVMENSTTNALENLSTGELPAGFAFGVVGRAITLGDKVFPSIAAVIKAVRSDTDYNIISTPQILTLDNEEAVIEVGENIPFVTRVDQGADENDRAIQNFEYKDVGVTLKVTPQINDNGYVRLNIEQSVKNVQTRTALEGSILAPTTTFRTAKTSIVVKDGETVVIGGLISGDMTRGKTQTPCLGGIPGLGWAFKQVGDEDSKRNLFIFLTPHIIKNPEEGKKLYEEKKTYMDREVEQSIKANQPEKLRRKCYDYE